MPAVQISLTILVIMYWASSIYGGLSMEENFSPEKTFDSESFLAKSLVQNEQVAFQKVSVLLLC